MTPTDRETGLRLRKTLLTLAGLPLALGGCSTLGVGGPAGSSASAPNPAPSGTPWLRYAGGNAASSPVPSFGTRTPAPALPSVSFLPIHPACNATFTLIDDVLIPLTVTPGKGSLSVTWPRQYHSNYRITAVRQPLISGKQPGYPWQSVTAGSGCTVTATISGLKPRVPYVVWLDAPNTGHERDGTRHLYSGRSGVVYPL
jgi:hypothetical protein